ncbi:hypothetical protein DVA67_015630 [Solirubrobacter sp. CPCC 204708]|uniref:YfhO family protein n=1 Tax=Solirubrobacter deserti TaxID=2282478 RepID=A0ABT4RN49_9ACTN|nr:hypothetical protein [Solirubrobacter deserti]MBE2317413.1 hypothetical protein [Solirubrobacter deserti]MDA0139995.1 hypothetical protein [Solirubrobacter deserti]
MTTFTSWVIAPIILLLMAGAVGLLAERVARTELPDGVLVGLGAWILVLVVLPVFLLGLPGSVAAAVALVLVALGLWFGRRGWLRPVRTPAALAGLLAYVLYLAPVLATGHWTWAGYNFVNDPALNWLMVDRLIDTGDSLSSAPPSTAVSVVNGTLNVSYPLGIHGLLATLNWILPVALPALYQPFIAFLAGVTAMAFTELARARRLPAWAAIAAAVLAVGSGLAYNYALHGGFKEAAVVGCLVTAAAIGRVALDDRLAPGPVALAALPLAAAIAIISTAAAAYAAVFAGVLLVAALGAERGPRVSPRAIVLAAAVAGAVFLVAIAPFLQDTIAFGQTASDQFGAATDDSTAVLGYLVRPLPLYQALGVWLRDDYRYPLEPGTPFEVLTIAALIVAGLLVVAGVFSELRERRWAALLVLVPAVAVALVAEPRLSPYGHAKLLVVLSPMAVFTAALGVWWLLGKVRVAGVLAGLVLVAGLLGSDALAYRTTQLAPTDRFTALEDAVEHTGGGRWLSLEWEEYAKYFGRDIQLNVGPEAYSPEPVALTRPEPIFGRSFDSDQLKPAYVESWDGLLLRRGPETSRPPSNFSRVYGNAYYELWRKDADAPRPLEHLSLGTDQQQAARPSCAAVRSLADRLGPAQRLVAAPARTSAELDPLEVGVPIGWDITAEADDVLIPGGQGRIEGPVDFARGGRYRVWVRGGAERPLTVHLDGKLIGSASGVNTAGSWLGVGEIEVDAGSHVVRLFRPGGSLRPGDSRPGVVGRVVFELVAAEALVTVAPQDVSSLCSGEWDWVERVAA